MDPGPIQRSSWCSTLPPHRSSGFNRPLDPRPDARASLSFPCLPVPGAALPPPGPRPGADPPASPSSGPSAERLRGGGRDPRGSSDSTLAPARPLTTSGVEGGVGGEESFGLCRGWPRLRLRCPRARRGGRSGCGSRRGGRGRRTPPWRGARGCRGRRRCGRSRRPGGTRGWPLGAPDSTCMRARAANSGVIQLKKAPSNSAPGEGAHLRAHRGKDEADAGVNHRAARAAPRASASAASPASSAPTPSQSFDLSRPSRSMSAAISGGRRAVEGDHCRRRGPARAPRRRPRSSRSASRWPSPISWRAGWCRSAASWASWRWRRS